MKKETELQILQQINAASESTNQKSVATKEEQQFKDGFEENNKKEKRMEEEKELQDIQTAKK